MYKIKLALDSNSVKHDGSYTFVSGNTEVLSFDDEVATALERDGFLLDMWNSFDGLMDWGDCDFFGPEKCHKLSEWAKEKSSTTLSELSSFYSSLMSLAERAYSLETGIEFDF